MNFLVLGVKGMAGHLISTYLIERGHNVVGLARSKVLHCKSVVGDARDIILLRTIIKEGKFDAVINCIGILNQFAEQNKELAVYLNSYLPHLLADITKNDFTQIIHMSTDCVFSGKKGHYTETDLPDGETFYDRTKALGELNDNKNITLRNSIVGPDINRNGIGLMNWFMKQENSVQGYSEVYWSGLTTLELAKTMEHVAKVKANGLFNMVNGESISKYQLLLLFNKYLRNDKVNIIPNNDLALNKSLKRTRFDFNYLVPDYEMMIIELAQWIKNHKQFYPSYYYL